MKQTRLEALKLATTLVTEPAVVIEVASLFEDYITNGQKVVELQPPAKLTLSSKRKGRK